MMSEVRFVVAEADAGLREHLYRECGHTPGNPHGHDDIYLVKQLR